MTFELQQRKSEFCLSYMQSITRKKELTSEESNLENLGRSEFTKAQRSMLAVSDITQYKIRLSQKWFTLQHKLNNTPLCQHLLFPQCIQYTNRTILEYREPDIFKQRLFKEISCQFLLIPKMENSTENIMLTLLLWLSKSQHFKTLKLAKQYHFTDNFSFLSQKDTFG